MLRGMGCVGMGLTHTGGAGQVGILRSMNPQLYFLLHIFTYILKNNVPFKGIIPEVFLNFLLSNQNIFCCFCQESQR